MCKRVIHACCYKEHLRHICRNMFCIRQYLSKKKKKRKEKIEKNEKWSLCFIQKSYMYMYMKKSGTLICNFFVSCDSRVGPTIQTAIFQFFCLAWQRLSKAYAINCSRIPKGAQNTLYMQKKKERTKINHPWPHFLAIPNSPVQFCPFPVYPGWQSHTCDPLVLVQFAFSWQEWFPLHSSMSMKPQMKKWDFRIMQILPWHKPLLCYLKHTL